MPIQVLLTDLARNDLDSACAWWAKNRSSEQAERWYFELIDTIQSLADNPQRYPLADENESFPYKSDNEILVSAADRPTASFL